MRSVRKHTESQPQVLNEAVDISLPALIRCRAAAKNIQFSRSRRVTTRLAGGYVSTLRGRGMDFDEVRVYQAGDDIRSMDWRVTARTGQPHTKLYREEKERPVFVLVDLSSRMFFGTKVAFKSVVAAKIAALVGWAAVDNGDRFGGLLFNEKDFIEFKPNARSQGILPMLKRMTEMPRRSKVSEKPYRISNALWRLRHVVKPGSLVVMISDFDNFDENAERHLSALVTHNQVIACSIHDPLEVELPPPNVYPISDGHKTVFLNTELNAQRDAYKQYFLKHQAKIDLCFKQRKVPHIKLFTDDDIENRLIHFFGKSQR